MIDFVSDTFRKARLDELRPYEIDYSKISQDEHLGYLYVRIAKINRDFPVKNYASPSTVAFMNPETLDIAMPTPERTPYMGGEHTLFHEIGHVYTQIRREDHDEVKLNLEAVEALRHKTGYDSYPYASYFRYN